MKEIVLSIALIAVVSVAAAYGLQSMNWTAESKFTSQQGNVRVQ